MVECNRTSISTRQSIKNTADISDWTKYNRYCYHFQLLLLLLPLLFCSNSPYAGSSFGG
jgi:hypothetical protein